jgi:hypothetical protein
MDAERDAQLAAAYRALEPAAPPPLLDDAILAAAHRAVGARPRAAGAPFAGRWQMPMSIAAVVVLCVSLVAVMRDEGSELTQPPHAEAPATAAHDAAAESTAVAKIELAPDTRSKNLGLKPPPVSAAAPQGADQYALAGPAAPTGMRAPVVVTGAEPAAALKPPAAREVASGRTAAPDKRERGDNEFVAPPPAMVAKAQPRADAVPAAEPAPVPGAAAAGAVAPRAETADRLERDAARLRTPSTEPQTATIQSQARPAAAPAVAGAIAQAKVGQAPARAAEAAAPGANREAAELARMSTLPPEKWLERIEELRRSGRSAEARAGLTAFRQRYPDYTLPAGLREWAEQ